MDRMSSERQQTIAIVGSTADTVLVVAVVIAGLIITQHAAMRADATN